MERLSLSPMWLKCHVTSMSYTQRPGSGEPSYMPSTLSLAETKVSGPVWAIRLFNVIQF